MFCVRDRKGEFWSPKIQQNEASATREFGQMINTPGTVMNYAPYDFELYLVGEFDSDVGKLIDYDKKQFIVSGESLVGARDEN